MAFDLEGARNAGFTDDEIADYLGKKSGFDTAAARRAGFETRDILAELSSAWAKQDLPEGVKPSDAGGGRGRVAPTDEAIPKPTPAKGPTPADLKQGPGAVLANVRQAVRPEDRIGKGGVPDQKPVIGRDPLSAPNPDFTPGPADLAAGQISDERALREAKQRAYTAQTGAPDARAPTESVAYGQDLRAKYGEGAADALLTANKAAYTTGKLGVDIANLATLGAAQPVSDWLGEVLHKIDTAKSPTSQKARGEFSKIMSDPEAGVLDVVGFLAANPRFTAEEGIPSIPSMLLGAQGAKLGMALLSARAGKTAAAEIGAGAANIAMNAGSSFSETQGSIGDKLTAAAGAGAGTALLGKLGGAETALATGGRGAMRTALREGAQEGGESLSQSLGQGAATDQFDPNQALKQAATEGTIGALIGGGAGAAAKAQDIRPVDVRAESFKRLDDVAAQHGISSTIVAAIKKAADGKPVEDLTGWMRRALAKLSQTGDIAPVSEETLALLDRQTEQDTPPSGPAPNGANNGTGDTPAPGQRETPQVDFSGLADTTPAPPATTPIEGEAINRNWSAFTPESGSMGIPREQMPQIKAEHRGALTNFLKARGITVDSEEVPADSLKPTQAEFSPRKVQQAKDFTGGDRAILISQDGYVIDGHHQWMAKREDGQTVKVMRIGAPVQDILRLAHQFPSSTSASGPASTPAPKSMEQQGASDGQRQEGRGQEEVLAPAPAVGVTYKAPDGRTMRVYVSTNNRIGVADEKGNKTSIARGSAGWAKMEQAIAASQPKTETAPQPAPAAAPVSQPARKPKLRSHPDTVRGSNALAEISRALGGISPDIISDLSQKTSRTRTSSKTGKRTVFTTWDNPAIPGVGPLFRRGGTSDLTEIARVLEDAGYIEAGLLERDYLEARNRAQDIIKAELSQGGSTLRIGDPEAEAAEARRQEEAASEDWAASDFWSPDDLDDSGYTDLGEDERIAADAILADVDAMGLDREAIIERASLEAGDLTTKEYHDVLKRIADEAVQDYRRQAGEADTRATGQGDEGSGSDAQAPGRSGSDRADGSDQAVRPEGQAEGLTLTSETEAEAQAKADREAQALADERKQREQEQSRLAKEAADREVKARADSTVDDFQLGQSADQQLSGQGDIFAQSDASAAPEKPSRAKIEDFGEKLEGARKDYAATLKDAESVDIRAEPLSKSWPEPDYEKLLAGGADPFVVAFIHAARDEIPTKPQKGWKLKGWTDTVQSLRETSRSLMAGEVSPAKVREIAGTLSGVMRTIKSRAELYELVGHGASLKGISFSENHYSIYRGQENVRKWVVEKKAKATTFGNWPSELAVADTKEDMLNQFKAKFMADKLGDDGTKKANDKGQFSIYRKRNQDGAFIGKKIGREYIDLKKLADVKEARAYLESNTADLVAALEKYKETPFERNPENRPRVGGDHRNGAPVTPEVFADTFGFRGVQFGNYVEQDRRQSDLNQAFDALMDMAAVMGLPPRAISLNGRLGLAFGARGKGGKNAPAAHYEPGTVVINLTKGSGPGSLGHEWWHAVDNYFGREFGEGGFATDGVKVDRLRAAMQEAFKAVRNATQAATLRRRAMELDKRRSKPYWNTPLELSARSFESYLIAKLQDQGAANDYLANVVDEKVWNLREDARASFFGGEAVETYPYPGSAELPAVRAAFDEFFKVVETKEDDAGNVAMLSRPSPTYFSALQRAAEANPMKAGEAGAWKQWIKGITNSGKVKAEEVAWSGLEEWLQLQPGKITKAQVVDYLASNGVRVEEVTLSNDVATKLPPGWRTVEQTDEEADFRWDLVDDTGEVRGQGDTPEEAIEDAQNGDALSDAPEAPKYAPYTLPGGTNYREVLLTLPSPADDRMSAAKKIGDAMARLRENAAPGEDYMRTPEYRALQDQMRALNEAPDPMANAYQSSHWGGVLNVLAHLRVNDRVDSDGRRILFVEEIQSDFGQATKKQQRAIAKAVDSDFNGIVERMKKAGVLEVDCD